MTEFVIHGGRKLRGCLPVQGSKNSALPLLAAALLICGEVVLENCPALRDVDCALDILTYLGCTVRREGDCVTVDARGMTRCDIPGRLMQQMRSSVVFLGAILARAGCATLTLPGGCMLGPRPIDYHIAALRALGTDVIVDGESLRCRTNGLTGCDITLPFPSVGATENALLAATAAHGTTRIRNAAREPEIVDLAAFLTAAGAVVRGAGTDMIEIEGGRPLHGIHYAVMPDRIAAGTYLCTAAATGGSIELTRVCPRHIAPLLRGLQHTGCDLDVRDTRIAMRAPRCLASVGIVETRPYPGFPTDLQPPLMALLVRAAGTSIFVENLFSSRYNHIEGLRRMGADIVQEGRFAAVHGVSQLHGASVTAPDLRAGAALVTAALAAEGETTIAQITHLERGYVRMDETLRSLGADMTRRER